MTQTPSNIFQNDGNNELPVNQDLNIVDEQNKDTLLSAVDELDKGVFTVYRKRRFL